MTIHEMEPQTACGKVLWHFCMSLDGFVAAGDLVNSRPDATQ